MPVVDTVAGHVVAALEAAGQDHVVLLDRICTQATGVPPRGLAAASEPVVPMELPGVPGRPEWYTPPVRVFDNLILLGQTRYTAWGVTTSEGIIIIDPLFDYSVEAEIVEGLASMGLDPETIRYVVVSHAHRDHAGGARYLQERFGARVLLAPADWDLLDATGGDWPKPERDIEAEDGYELVLGETTLTLYHTPGHTPGTMSTLIPVWDGGTPHVAALWGGTAFNFAGRPDEVRWYEEYINSAERFRTIAANMAVDVLLSNHPQYDGSPSKVPALDARLPGGAHPYVVGGRSVDRYLSVASECAKAGRLNAS